MATTNEQLVKFNLEIEPSGRRWFFFVLFYKIQYKRNNACRCTDYGANTEDDIDHVQTSFE